MDDIPVPEYDSWDSPAAIPFAGASEDDLPLVAPENILDYAGTRSYGSVS